MGKIAGSLLDIFVQKGLRLKKLLEPVSQLLVLAQPILALRVPLVGTGIVVV
jgi:hypothetical protein